MNDLPSETDVARDGTRYEYRPGPNPAVVLVHGLGLNRHMWQWQLDALGARHAVLTYDLLGHGETPPGDQTPSLTAFSEQLKRLLTEIGLDRVVVAGFSLGGMIARRFAIDHGEKTLGVAILHSAHQRSADARAAVQVRVEQARRNGPSATIDGALSRWFSDDFQRRAPQTLAQVRTWILANDPDVYPQNYQVLVDGVDELIAPSPPISCPALVMTGSDDTGNTPEMSRAIADELPNANTVILPELRHMAMVEAPDLFNTELLAFLNTLSPQAPHD